MDFLNNYECYFNASLKKYNTYRIDATCKCLVFVHSVNELIELLKNLKDNNMDYIILGNGSNIILASDYYDKVIIKLDKLNNITFNDKIVKVESGYPLPKLSFEILKHNLIGLEFAAGIPGLVGSSVAMNAGAYNKSMADVVKEITILDEDLNIRVLKNNELKFRYRDSLLKENKKLIVLEVTLELEHGDILEAKELIETRRQRRISTQPLNYPSSGSVFRNPEGMHAGELIEKCNLKGYNINGAEISEKHANFIINKDNCNGSDIISLINLIKDKVKEKYNIDLILEQEIID